MASTPSRSPSGSSAPAGGRSSAATGGGWWRRARESHTASFRARSAPSPTTIRRWSGRSARGSASSPRGSRCGRRSCEPTSSGSGARSSRSRSCSRSCGAVSRVTRRIAGSSGTRSPAVTSGRGSPRTRTSVATFRPPSSRTSLTRATTCGISRLSSREPWRTTMEQRELLYEGKAKQIYRTSDPDLLIQHFKDDATAFNAKKRGTIADKGILNNRMSEVLFRFLEEQGVATHFVRRISDRDMLVRACEIVKIEVVARNLIAGSLAKRLGKPEGELLPEPILEHYYKDDALDDPMLNDWHVRSLKH